MLNLGVLVIFCDFWQQKSELRRKWMEIDQNYLRTGTAIGSRAFPEH